MRTDLTSIGNRIRTIVDSEGITSLVIKAIKLILGGLFRYEKYYAYKNIFPEIDEADLMPDVGNFSVYFISSNDEADKLAMELPDFRGYSIYSKKRLDTGAIACCIFVDREFAHVGWIALDRKSQEMITPYPYPVDFANEEACTGGSYTMKKFRGKGLLTYGHYRRMAYLRDKGIETVRDIVDVNNIAVQKVKVKLSHKKYARARYLKVFGFKFWKQTPL
jgi:RimJ/RimL family protein N-acetyltransferase